MDLKICPLIIVLDDVLAIFNRLALHDFSARQYDRDDERAPAENYLLASKLASFSSMSSSIDDPVLIVHPLRVFAWAGSTFLIAV